MWQKKKKKGEKGNTIQRRNHFSKKRTGEKPGRDYNECITSASVTHRGFEAGMEERERVGGKKKRKGQVYRLVAAADCNGRAIAAAGTWIRALARARKENQQNRIRARERHGEKRRGGWERRRREEHAKRWRGIGVNGIGEPRSSEISLVLTCFRAILVINRRLIFRHAILTRFFNQSRATCKRRVVH